MNLMAIVILKFVKQKVTNPLEEFSIPWPQIEGYALIIKQMRTSLLKIYRKDTKVGRNRWEVAQILFKFT